MRPPEILAALASLRSKWRLDGVSPYRPDEAHRKRIHRHEGRDYRLTDIHGELVKGILA